jgi:hypothetical protein
MVLLPTFYVNLLDGVSQHVGNDAHITDALQIVEHFATPASSAMSTGG